MYGRNIKASQQKANPFHFSLTITLFKNAMTDDAKVARRLDDDAMPLNIDCVNEAPPTDMNVFKPGFDALVELNSL